MQTLTEARTARDMGMQQAAARADRAVDNWTERALAFVRDYFKPNRAPTLAEQVRADATAAGIPDPPDARAWGAVFARAKRERLVMTWGSAKAVSSRMSLKPLWRAVA
jgi:hypothetical protein